MISIDTFIQQGDEIRSLVNQLNEEQLVHAMLISGEKGLGKRTLATLIAAGLMCRADHRRPCGECRSCKSAMNLEHPDITVIRKGIPISPHIDKGRSTIPVDDIREMIRIAGERTLEGGARVFLIFEADRMTPQAQNSLLKTLEEPPENTYMILVTDHAENLLNTVVSRCRNIHLRPWKEAYVVRVLLDNGVEPARARNASSDAMGSIGKALDLASNEDYWTMRKEVFQMFFNNTRRSDIIRFSNEWKERKNDAEQMLEILETLVRPLIRFRLLGDTGREFNEYPANWQKWAMESDYSRIADLLDAIRTARMENISNVNFQASVEQLLLLFSGEGTK